jgi:hypothetical protein
MMKVVPVMAFYFLIISACAGQVKPVEYRDTVFSTVRVEPDLAYRSPLPAGKAGKGYHLTCMSRERAPLLSRVSP